MLPPWNIDFIVSNLHPFATGLQPPCPQTICPDDCGFDGADSAPLRSASRFGLESSRFATGFFSGIFSHSLSSLTL
jgi:hypothetical protein